MKTQFSWGITMKKARFGVAGNDEAFYNEGYKSSLQMPERLKKIGLDAYEYQCGRGVMIRTETARELGERAAEHGIRLSVHAPYYISLSSSEEKTRLGSIKYILQSARAAKAMRAGRIVLHSGSLSGRSRNEALELAKDTLRLAIAALKEEDLFKEINLCPETMGKKNQLGTVEEVLELCAVHESFIPTLDFGHINCITGGALKRPADFEKILNQAENKLGEDRLKFFHCHFTKIQYGQAGERMHLTYDDTEYGPEFEPLAEVVAKKNLAPVIISESNGTQARDALIMKSIYEGFLEC